MSFAPRPAAGQPAQLPTSYVRVWDRAASLMPGCKSPTQARRRRYEIPGEITGLVTAMHSDPALLARFVLDVQEGLNLGLLPSGNIRASLLTTAEEDAEADVARAHLLAGLDSIDALDRFIREATESLGATMLALREAKARRDQLKEAQGRA
jgi:hypothetical protein